MRKRLFSIFYMFLVTLFFTSLVSAVNLSLRERIEKNQIVKLQKVILKVLDIKTKKDGPVEDLIQTFENRVKKIDVKGKTLYMGYEEDGKTLMGYAFTVGGSGFWGPVYGMVGVDPQSKKILGIAFYKQSETPGLGGRITEAWFKKQFVGLPLYPIHGDKKIFYLKPPGTGTASNDLDAITGATGTSRAVEEFLNRELDDFLKVTWESMNKG